MSHVRALLLASALGTASLLVHAAPVEHRWRLRLFVWATGILLGLGAF